MRDMRQGQCGQWERWCRHGGGSADMRGSGMDTRVRSCGHAGQWGRPGAPLLAWEAVLTSYHPPLPRTLYFQLALCPASPVLACRILSASPLSL